MEIKITIKAPSAQATRVGLLVGVPLALLLGGQWAARADYTPKPWADQELLSAEKMNGEFAAISAELAALRQQIAEPRCPPGYEEKADPDSPTIVLCARAGQDGKGDEVVRVGKGASLFWIDRYEASFWKEEGGGAQFGQFDSDNLPSTFPKSGQYSEPLYARSVAGVAPSRHTTWFQAEAACRASGKRLPRDAEWLTAARGTIDPGASNGIAGSCVTSGNGPRVTGGGVACVSASGAQDMIGNLWEWVAEWHMSAGNSDSELANNAGATVAWKADPVFEPGADYKGDAFWNVGSRAIINGSQRKNSPAAAMRGGSWGDGEKAGLFALYLGGAPAHWYSNAGFRCVVPHN